VQDQVADMREMVDEMSRAGIKTGLFSGQLRMTVEENMGTYVTRQYKAHHEDDYSETIMQAVRDYADEDMEIDPENVPESLGVDPRVWNKAVAHLRNANPGMSPERIRGELFTLLSTDETGGLYEEGSKLGSVGSSIYERRKDIPGPIRDLLGEYKDPGENYLRSANKMLRGVVNQRFLNRVKKAGLGEYLHEEPVVEDGVVDSGVPSTL